MDDALPPPARCRGLLVGAALLYAAAALALTWPMARHLGDRLPGYPTDPLQALWVMGWYRDCLTHGRLPFHCPEIQYPTGAALGNFSPLHLAAVLFLPLSAVCDNDVLCYNLVWLASLTFTGVGTLVLVERLVGDRACAFFGGLMGMASGPVLLHAQGHLELVAVGGLPLFLVAWIDLVEAPSGRRLLAAAFWYVIVALSAAYFAVFALVPAAVFLLTQLAGEPRPFAALRARLRPLAGFVALTLPCLLLLFSGQLLSRFQGHALPRPSGEAVYYGAPVWSAHVPARSHLLGSVLPYSLYEKVGSPEIECCSYLGLVPLLLIGYAAVARVELRWRGSFWLLVGLLMVLSWGMCLRLGSLRVSMPAEWLRTVLPPFQLIRVPARFNLLLAVTAPVLAAAGLRHLLARLGRARAAASVLLTVVAAAELAIVPFPTSAAPTMPGCYEFVRARAPGARVLEAPQYGSGSSEPVNVAAMYWQPRHGLTTTAGYSGFDHVPHDTRFFFASPFAAPLLDRPQALARPGAMTIDLIGDVGWRDSAWLYLTTHEIDFVVLHEGPGLVRCDPESLAAMRRELAEAEVGAGPGWRVYDRRRLREPERPTLLGTNGWRYRAPWHGRVAGAMTRVGRLAVFNPCPEQPLTFRLDAVAFRRPRTVRLLADGQELARWTIGPEEYAVYESPPVHLRAGRTELVLECDSDDAPSRGERTYEGDPTPYSLRVARMSLAPVAVTP